MVFGQYSFKYCVKQDIVGDVENGEYNYERY